MDLLTVVAEFLAKPGKEAELERQLLGLIDTTRKEEGCVQYDLHVATDEPRRFLFFENWTGRDALDKHLAAPHLEALRSALDDLLAEPLRIVTYRKLA